jgi:hypothetical protein
MDVRPFNRNQCGLSVVYAPNEDVEPFIFDGPGHRYKLEHARPRSLVGKGGYHCTYVRDDTRA